VNDETVDEAEALLDTLDLTDVLPAPSLREPVAERLLSVEPVVDHTFGGASMAGNALRDHLTPLEPFDAVDGLDTLDTLDTVDTLDAVDATFDVALDPIDTLVPVDTIDPTFDITFDVALDTALEPVVSSPTAEIDAFDGLDLLEPESPLDALALDLTDDRFPGAVADAEPAQAPAPTAAPATAPTLLPDNGLLLDFAVEHGMANDEAALVQRAPISLPVPDMHEPAVARAPEVTVEPRLTVVSAGSTRGIAPIDNMVPTAPPLPETSAAAAVPTAPARPAPTPTGGQRPVRRTPESRVVLPAPTESKGKGGLIAIGAAVVAAGGAAAFFLLR
jgi:hypothetical protein